MRVGARAHGVLEAVRARAAARAGSGRRACPACGGDRRRDADRAADGRACRPALADGARIRVAGQGARRRATAASPAISTSTVHVQPHPLFRREGDDLHVDVPVAVHEAALGAKIDVPSLDGPARAARAAGHAVGPALPRCASAASPSPRDGRRGDLVVEVRLVLPKVLDERSKELLREFGRINGEDVERSTHVTRDVMKKHSGKAYYMISAVAQKYNIHPQTLRLYEREGLLKPSRTEGNTRLYSEEDLEQLETILSLTRDLGVNLAGVEIILNMRRKIEQMQGEVNEFMEYVKRELARGIDDWEQRLSHRARQVVADRSRQARRSQTASTNPDRDAAYAVRRRTCASRLRADRLRYNATADALRASATTPAGSRSTIRRRPPRRALRLLARAASGTQRLADANIPQALSALHARQLRRLQRVARAARSAQARRVRRRVSRRYARRGCCSKGSPASARRISRSPC